MIFFFLVFDIKDQYQDITRLFFLVEKQSWNDRIS